MRKLSTIRTLFLLMMFSFFFIACKEGKTYSMVDDEFSVQIHQEKVSEIKANIIDSKDSWDITESYFNRVEKLAKSKFYDTNNGWIVSKSGSLWTTSNAGKTWSNKIDIMGINEFSILDITFISPTSGFVSANKRSKAINDTNDFSLILKTDDGGKNWREVYDEKAVILTNIHFSNDYEIWAVGRKSTFDSHYHRNHFVLHTIDKGETWLNVSDKLNELATDGRGEVDDSLTGIYSKEANKAIVLSLRGKMFQTTDGGKNWQLLSFLPNEPMQTCICHLGRLETGEIWVGGGIASMEGEWGMLAIKQSNNSWLRNRLNGFYFIDIKFISNNEVVASGSVYDENIKNNSKRSGIILLSKIFGRNWTVIHRSTRIEEFNSIVSTSPNNLFVAGSNGGLVHLENSRNITKKSVDIKILK